MTRIAFCLTCYEQVDPWSERGFLDLAIAFGRMHKDIEVVPFVRDGLPCADACNLLMDDVAEYERAQDWRFDRVFWMDDDVVLTTEDLPKLLAAVDTEHPAVFALAFLRTAPHRAAIWRYAPTPTAEGMVGRAVLEYVSEYPADSLIPIHCAGLCAALLDRAVFDKLEQPYFAWLEGGYQRSPCTPDGYLCAKLVGASVPLFCHTGVRTKHIGLPQIVDEAFAMRHREGWV